MPSAGGATQTASSEEKSAATEAAFGEARVGQAQWQVHASLL